MNLLLTISDSYVGYTAVMLQTLAESNVGMNFDVWVVCPDITDANKQKLQRQFAEGSHSAGKKFLGVKIHFPQISANVKAGIEDMASSIVKSLNTTFILRLYATDILPESLQKVLYIDVDTAIASSIKDLDEISLGDDCALAAVKDLVRPSDYPRLGIDETKHVYFNSGVMLINLDYWRKHSVGSRCRELLKKYAGEYTMPDQDALNVACQGKVQYLHPRYNCLVFFFARREFLKARIRKEEFDRVQEAAKDPAIIHYVFVNKPWNKGGYLPKRELWESALSRTEWHDMPIKYKNGFKGWLHNTLRTSLSYLLPVFGKNLRSDIFIRRRYKIVQLCALAIYYGFAYWLPNFDSRFFGKLSNKIRLMCVRRIFDYCGEGVNIGRKARFGVGSNVWIGYRSNIGAKCLIPSDIIIGDNVMMGPNNFFFGNFTHNISDVSRPMIEQGFKFVEGRFEICDDVWIGRDCLFMPCKKIGSHSVVGARSVVTKDVPESVIVAGNPARIIKERK